MADTEILNDTILEEKTPEVFIPSQKEQEVVGRVFHLFRWTADERNRNYEYMDGRNIIDYIDDSVKNFITNIDAREGIEDWQARINDPFTRNKIIAILGKVAPLIPVAEFSAVGEEDFRREQMLNDLVDFSNRVDDNEQLMFNALLEAIVKGTVVGYEGYEEKTKPVRDIVKYDSGTKIKTKDGKKKIRKVFGAIIPLEDFYPSSVGIPKIKSMPYCFWRSRMTAEQFKMVFAQYEQAKHVQPFQTFSGDETRPFYTDYISSDIREGIVEVIRYYNQDTDEFAIIANGVWLNPLSNEDVMPIPFNHKSLPFWSAIYEPFGSDFFYGKSLADKLKAVQKVLNVLHNMFLDQTFLSIFPPILVGGTDDIEDDILRPGRRITVDDATNYKELQMTAGQGFHQFVLNYTKRVMEETSIDAVQQGVAGVGERTTATEIERAAQAVTGIIGLFIMFIKWGVRDKERLRAKNVLQFYKAPMIERVLGEGASAEYKKAFNVFKIDDTVLTSGKRGLKIIEMFKDRKAMPTKKELRTQAKMTEVETGKRVEKVAINPNYLRDFEFDVKLIPNPKAQMSKATEMALQLEKTRVYMEFFPDILDREEAAIQIAEKFGDKPEKVFKLGLGQEQPIQEQGQFPGAGKIGVGQNMLRGLTGEQSVNAGARNIKQMSR
ncbi:MAG TPA: hypothetical protein ENI23_16200 [bacterium]|nr:hypothetical protein [bacterium]